MAEAEEGESDEDDDGEGAALEEESQVARLKSANDTSNRVQYFIGTDESL